MALRIGRLVLVVYVGYCALLLLVQRRLAFAGASRDPVRAEPVAPPGVDQIWLETPSGRSEAWLFRAEDPTAAPTLIFAHGNGELIADWTDALRRYAQAGVNVLAVEYPGYGHSEGRTTRASIDAAFEAAYDWLDAQGEVDTARIVAYGRSLGGGAASDLALTRPVAALVLQSTFSTAASLAWESFVPGFLVLDRFDNVNAVRSFDGPVLLMHGRADDVLAFRHAERLSAARPGLAITELACAHNDCGRIWPDIVRTVVDFLAAQGLMASDPTDLGRAPPGR